MSPVCRNRARGEVAAQDAEPGQGLAVAQKATVQSGRAPPTKSTEGIQYPRKGGLSPFRLLFNPLPARRPLAPLAFGPLGRPLGREALEGLVSAAGPSGEIGVP